MSKFPVIQGFLTRRTSSKTYLLTTRPPEIVQMHGSGVLEPYGCYGDPFMIQGICDYGREHIFHLPRLRPLETHEVAFQAWPVGEPFRADGD